MCLLCVSRFDVFVACVVMFVFVCPRVCLFACLSSLALPRRALIVSIVCLFVVVIVCLPDCVSG